MLGPIVLAPLVLAVAASAQQPTQSFNNVTGTANITFPTDVGFAGPVKYEGLPLLAQDDAVNSTVFQNNGYGIEMREAPLNATLDKATPDDIFRNLGTTSPYRAADDLFPETNAYRTMPEQCEIKQVHILHRHGARNPTLSAHEASFVFGSTVVNASKAGNLSASGDLAFLNDWNLTIGAESLVHQGTQELFDSGVKHYYDYARLMQNYTEKLVFRTTSQSRMLDSARYWALGFFGWKASELVNLEVLTETSNQNDTLAAYYSCPNSNEDSFFMGDKLSSQWQEVYTQAPIKRIQPMIPGVKLTPSLMYGMMSLCPYETVAVGSSRFCDLFTKTDWENYEYDIDLQFQGDYGFMNPTGKAQGLGWVIEFLSRLNSTSFQGPVSGQNTTLDENSTYFPTNQPLYADFTHDDIIHSVLTSLNVTQISDFLPATEPNPNRRYRASRVTPFAARLVWEVMDCKDDNNNTSPYIRAKINEAVIPLNEDQGCTARPDGLCKLTDFWSHQWQNAPKDAKFDLVCFGKNGTDFTVTGPVRNGTI